jgi:CubicO group peptidase (beta-lactamase class C family)
LELDRRTFLKRAAASAALLAPSSLAMQAPIASPTQPPNSAGAGKKDKPMSATKLSASQFIRLHDTMAGFITRGEIPGLIALVSQGDLVHVDAIGTLGFNSKSPVQRDTIFRIASMTKPITAAAAMILVDESKIRLDDPVDGLLPELANRKVLKRLDAPLDDTVPAKRPITTRDLLAFTWGFGLVFAPPDAYPILKAANDLQIGMGAPQPSKMPLPDEWIRRLGTLPLMVQPGEKWLYNTGSDVLGVLVARACGKPFEVFLRERIFEPLGMKDTGFFVPAVKLNRFPTEYWNNFQTGALEVYDEPSGQWAHPPAFPSGAGGLVSTVDDYLAFSRMMLNRGALGKHRILSPASVQAMTTDQLTLEQKSASGLTEGYFGNHGWGFGVSLVTRRVSPAEPVGMYGWNGGLGTSWNADPKHNLTGILLTQRAWTSPKPPPVCQDFWSSIYQLFE